MRKKSFLMLLALFFMLSISPGGAHAVENIIVKKGPCSVSLIYPERLVKLLNECYNTDRYMECAHYSGEIGDTCPFECLKAFRAHKPYGDKLRELRGPNAISMDKFSTGETFGWIISNSGKNCPQFPATPSCNLPSVCNTGLWNVMP